MFEQPSDTTPGHDALMLALTPDVWGLPRDPAGRTKLASLLGQHWGCTGISQPTKKSMSRMPDEWKLDMAQCLNEYALKYVKKTH